MAASTIFREVWRNAATRSGGLEYRAAAAQWHSFRFCNLSQAGEGLALHHRTLT
jgi:hypothetical protein